MHCTLKPCLYFPAFEMHSLRLLHIHCNMFCPVLLSLINILLRSFRFSPLAALIPSRAHPAPIFSCRL